MALLSLVAGCSSSPEVKKGQVRPADLVCGKQHLVVRDVAPEGQHFDTPKAAAEALARRGEHVKIESRFSGTAKLLVRRANGDIRLVVTVVRAGGSWARTKVAHCP
ncbi:MAG TPA: hypothetical protein VFJ19_18955 [Nocardioidaceae bacterium]|nr:hypothetical protein [Nocardioidaceae bacterium]